MRQGDLGALLAISPALSGELMATGRPAWQVLAGAMRPAVPATGVPATSVPATAVLYADAPFGVAYMVAFFG